MVSGAAAPERGAQTGHRGAVSYTGLVLDLHRSHRGEQLLDQVVLLVVERGTAEVREAECAIDSMPVVVALLPALLAGRDRPLGDHVHRLVELELLPLGAAGPAISHLRQAAALLDELARGGALRAERALVDGRARVALDVDQLAVARVDDLAAADGAVRADRLGGLQAGDARPRPLGLARGGPRPHPQVGQAPDAGRLAQPLPGVAGHPAARYPLGGKCVGVGSTC